MSENALDRGLRYLAEARLIVTHVDDDVITARCRGTGAEWTLGHSPARGWYCDCPSLRYCAHVYALMAVTVRHGAASSTP